MRRSSVVRRPTQLPLRTGRIVAPAEKRAHMCLEDLLNDPMYEQELIDSVFKSRPGSKDEAPDDNFESLMTRPPPVRTKATASTGTTAPPTASVRARVSMPPQQRGGWHADASQVDGNLTSRPPRISDRESPGTRASDGLLSPDAVRASGRLSMDGRLGSIRPPVGIPRTSGLTSHDSGSAAVMRTSQSDGVLPTSPTRGKQSAANAAPIESIANEGVSQRVRQRWRDARAKAQPTVEHGDREARRSKESGGKSPSKVLARLLDELIPLRSGVPDGASGSGKNGVSSQSLREALRQYDVFDRVVDLFHKFDTDKSGEVDLREFTAALSQVIEGCRHQDCAELFHEFDRDRSGRISYKEMQTTMKAANEAKLRTHLVVPELPYELRNRKRDVFQLYKQFQKQKLVDDRTRSVPLPTFDACLRLYYPKDPKEVTAVLVKWVEDVLAAKLAAAEARIRESDATLIASLDEDGSGNICITEFCTLSKSTGLSKVQLRARFRDKDLGNSGYLTMEQMRDVLCELREEARARAARLAEGDAIQAKARAAADAMEATLKRRMAGIGVADD